MIDTTPTLALPLLHTAQAQKEFTHNEALVRLDALVGGVLAGGPLAVPPEDADDGTLWLVAPDAAAEWAGRGDQLAIASANGWRFVDPPVGFALARADGRPVRRSEEGWRMVERRAIPSPAGGEVVDAEARAAVSALLELLRDQGLVAPTA